MYRLHSKAAPDFSYGVLFRYVKDRDGKGGKVVKLTGSLDAKSRWVTRQTFRIDNPSYYCSQVSNICLLQ